MRRTILVGCLAVGLAIALAGCAAIMHGSKQSVSFESEPAGATVSVTDAFGMVQGGCETPCKLDLKRKHEYKVTIAKDGFDSVDLSIDKHTDGWIWGNLLFGGLIGLVVDLSSGSCYRLSPHDFSVTLTAKTMGDLRPGPSGVSLVIIDYARLSPAEKEKLKSIKPIPIGAL